MKSELLEVNAVIYKCEVCGVPVPAYVPEYCCSGSDYMGIPNCGCMGLPIEPCICSEQCWAILLDKKKEEIITKH